MDNGLDIDERRCVLAFYLAAPDSPGKLAKFARVFVRSLSEDAPTDEIRRSLTGLARRLNCSLRWEEADRTLAWAARNACRLTTVFDPDYPPRLAEITHPPLVLFVNGDAAVLARNQIAIVGSRKASHYGLETAAEIAHDLARLGVVVTSGMAAGIDAAAHHGALAGGGQTVAVFGCGIDRIYPRRHVRLSELILERGAIVSEFPLGFPPRPYHFPRRNRIISGLCDGTVVVEAASKSGSMSTAMHALQQSRDVFAVPGSIRNPLTAGCHALINDGAMLVNGASDIIAQYPDLISQPQSAKRPPAAPERRDGTIGEREKRVLDACAFDAANFDQIVLRSGLTPTDVSSILSALEVRGAVRSLAGNTYLRITD